ncbi:hypothetical protein EDD15DRAFT_2390995 [Pisolithus albus]|nr:hypothetical protein EDD15DRAFT_2390995 [Pisolithus albus]
MPLLYRPDRASSPPPEPLDSVQLTDVDDSIVLSDLLRTGEASRLRRRGAMRLDHNALHSQRHESGRTSPPTIITPASPSWVEPTEDDDDDDTQTWEQADDTASLSAEVRFISDPDPCDHVLYCGREDPTLELTVGRGPYEPASPLPSSVAARAPRRRDARHTNGCGAVVHLRAWRRERTSVWVGKHEATSAVIPIDPSYFDRPSTVRVIRSPCGCVREPVGCAICGNPLGTRHKPCEAASAGLFSSNSSSAPPICPEGPRYWHGLPARPSSRYFFMFFADRVSSSRSGFRGSSFRDRHTDNSIDYDPFERLVSPSPRPLNDGDQENIEDNSSHLQVDPDPSLDPDGTIIASSEPDSPDKSSPELISLPER